MTELDLTILEIGSGGDGIAQSGGRTHYVPFTAPGEQVRARVVEEKSGGVYTELLEIKAPGPDRVKALCRHFTLCGGCAMQHLTPAFTAEWKRQRIIDCLRREGIRDTEVLATLTSPPHSRRRVEFIASRRKKSAMLGFHLRRSHQIFDIGDCPVITPSLLALVKPLRALMSELLPRKSDARLLITETEQGPDLLITADIEMNLAAREKLAGFAAEQSLARIAWRASMKDLPEVIAARLAAEVSLGGVPVLLPPGTFLQATQFGEAALGEVAMPALRDAKRIVDLFAGAGSFTLPLAALAPVHGVEGDAALTGALQAAANRAQRPVSTECRDLFQRPLLAAELDRYDGLLFDPPRAGAKAQSEEIAKSEVPTVVAISCNPVTFARDMAILQAGGYALGSVQPVDQFLFSPHVEMAAVLTRR